ncbi:hypothetical protein QBC32DRAFT_365515 [Pseudoneurospora amorphoporcata]|uniref:Uncharacterized protein n=1 Tax=Pseudoneurospora amorphoporcata TaxID=241081 RepID=A0AAN6NMI1_9PEZI|nr:hypothetical protein QBC32DRAFT_365515 [Pseudoneurospora amorphoporcata]
MANVRYTFKKEDLYAFLYAKISAIVKYYSKKGDGLSFAFRLLTTIGKEKMYEYAMNFFNYKKAAEDENIELKKKTVLLENTITNTSSRKNIENDPEPLRRENVMLRS